MPLHFRKVRSKAGDLSVELDLSFENGVFVGLTGPNGSGKSVLLRLAAGSLAPESGAVEGFETASLASESLNSANPALVRGSIDEALETRAHVLVIGPCFALTDPAYQNRTLARIHELKRRGSIVVLVSHDLALLERHCDEVAVMENGRVVDRGDPQLVLRRYRTGLIETQRESTSAGQPAPSSRHGDKRARVLNVEIVGADGKPSAVVQSGEIVTARVSLEFLERVGSPVVGILIRNRIGVNVYGTNTELEKVGIGPCLVGEQVELGFTFACDLCAEQYTLTVASHDPDGTAHDWLEEAIFFTVADARYTAGFANLRAKVTVRRLEAGAFDAGRS